MHDKIYSKCKITYRLLLLFSLCSIISISHIILFYKRNFRNSDQNQYKISNEEEAVLQTNVYPRWHCEALCAGRTRHRGYMLVWDTYFINHISSLTLPRQGVCFCSVSTGRAAIRSLSSKNIWPLRQDVFNNNMQKEARPHFAL